MKTLLKISLSALLMILLIQPMHAQNYKAPKIDASGRITDKNGKYMGDISKTGVVKDTSGAKIAHVDAEGTLIDDKTGKKLGKSEKNGNFAPYFAGTPDAGWTVNSPLNGTCLVKDKDGNVTAEVHENYKAFGACAIHCLTNHMDHGDVMDNATAAYVCPMHTDVTSDKSGKCSKCGMDLVKKK